MKRCMVLCLLTIAVSVSSSWAQTQPSPAKTAATKTKRASVEKYGSNPAVGKTFTNDGVKLYYEVYGTGQPLLLVHGNGLSIASLAAQIVAIGSN